MKIIRKALLYVLMFGLIAPLYGQAKYPKRGLSFGHGSTREKDPEEMSGSLSWFYNRGTRTIQSTSPAPKSNPR